LHHYAKGPNVIKISQSVADITIFRLFNMSAAAVLDFQNSRILLADGVRRIDMDHCAKFRQNPSFRSGVIAIFQFFKMAAVCNLGFPWSILDHPQRVGLLGFVTALNLVAIDAV